MPQKTIILNRHSKRALTGKCGSSSSLNFFPCIVKSLCGTKTNSSTTETPQNNIWNCKGINGGNGGLGENDGYDCNVGACVCNNSPTYNHDGYCVNGTYYIWPSSINNCSQTTVYILKCNSVLFSQTSDTEGETAYELMTKYVGWYFKLSSPPSNQINIGESSPPPPAGTTYPTLTLSIQNVVIKVDTGNSSGCFKTPQQYTLCDSSTLKPIYPPATIDDMVACSDCGYQA